MDFKFDLGFCFLFGISLLDSEFVLGISVLFLVWDLDCGVLALVLIITRWGLDLDLDVGFDSDLGIWTWAWDLNF